jgi:hypothetical protein
LEVLIDRGQHFGTAYPIDDAHDRVDVCSAESGTLVNKLLQAFCGYAPVSSLMWI